MSLSPVGKFVTKNLHLCHLMIDKALERAERFIHSSLLRRANSIASMSPNFDGSFRSVATDGLADDAPLSAGWVIGALLDSDSELPPFIPFNHCGFHTTLLARRKASTSYAQETVRVLNLFGIWS